MHSSSSGARLAEQFVRAQRYALLTTTGPRGSQTSLPYARLLERSGYRVHQRLVAEATSARQLASILRLGWRVRRYDLIVANEYSTAIGLGMLANLFRAKARMVVLGLNLSRRAFKVGIAPIQRTINQGLRRFDSIVVHSNPEIDSFVELHNLDRGRFEVIPWGFDLPQYSHANLPDLPRRYVTVIGRNNRDFGTVAAGLAGTGISGVFVGVDRSFESDEADIRCFSSLPFEQCLKIIAGAVANVILVKDGSRGAGHITAVSGMLLGKPHIFSDVATLSEYLKDGRHGIAVPLGDSTALKKAVRHLASDAVLASRMGSASREHAIREYSHVTFMARIFEAIVGRSTGPGG